MGYTDDDPELAVEYTVEQRRAMNKRARDAARREFDSDPNRRDPKHTQDRMDAAVHELRVRMGLDQA
jgi:hypothetical protein